MISRAFKLRNLLIPVSCVGVMAYFAYHAVHGDHGLYAAWTLNEEVGRLKREQAGMIEVRKQLEHKVSLMRPESLDPDTLDEQARTTLNMAHPNDITIIRKSQF